MGNKVKYGLKNVWIAKLTESTSGAVSFGTPRHVPGAVALSLPPVGDKTAFYADDIEYYTSIQNNGYEGTLEVALIPDWFKADFLGETADENNVYTENANCQPERFAMMFEFDGDVTKTRHVVYNCKATRPNVEGNTKNATAEPKTETLNVTVKPLPDGKVKARTSEKTQTSVYNGWFDDVYGQTSTAAGVSPKTATFDKNVSGDNYSDIEIAVTNDAATDVQIAGATIGSGNFTVASGSVTIKKEYLATLSTGTKTFAVVMTSGAEKEVTITIENTAD